MSETLRAMSSQSCPSCGAPFEVKSRAALLIVCEYCNSTLLRQEQALEDIGKMALLQEDGSPLQLGARGEYRGKSFEVVGRIQLDYPAGYWNEWFVIFSDRREGWLGEGQGQYTMTFLDANKRQRAPGFAELFVGKTLKLGADTFTVTEVSKARCVAGAGELPFQVATGYDANLADLTGTGTLFATLDYSETPPLVFLGERVEFDDLKMTNLRQFEGW